jgi:CO dehydrogenase/acetyl-CoA synthase alpha subunit
MTHHSWRNFVRSHSWTSGAHEISLPPPKASSASEDDIIDSFSEAEPHHFLLDRSAVVDKVMWAMQMTIDAKSSAKEKEIDDSTAGYMDDEDRCCKCLSTAF